MGNWEMKGKPALVIIHMQDSVISENGKLAFFGLAKVAKQSGIIPRQQALLEAFRNKKLPVIFIFAVTPTTATFPAHGKFWSVMESMRPNPPGSKETEIIPELTPRPGESVIGNWPIGGFSNTNLGQILKGHGVETIVLVGVATDHAVLATTLQAVELGYTVIVPNDGAISTNTRAHEVVMNDILPNISLTATTEDVLAHL